MDIHLIWHVWQTWWFTTSIAVACLIRLFEISYNGLYNQQRDIRPVVLNVLSACALVMFIYATWIQWAWLDFNRMWAMVNGPLLRLCVIRYVHGFWVYPNGAAAQSLHMWITVACIRLITYTGKSVYMQQARDMGIHMDAAFHGYTLWLLYMLWVAECSDFMTTAYIAYAMPRCRAISKYALRHYMMPNHMTYRVMHTLMHTLWFIARVMGYTCAFVICAYATKSILIVACGIIIILGQLSLWLDMYNLAPVATEYTYIQKCQSNMKPNIIAQHRSKKRR